MVGLQILEFSTGMGGYNRVTTGIFIPQVMGRTFIYSIITTITPLTTKGGYNSYSQRSVGQGLTADTDPSWVLATKSGGGYGFGGYCFIWR